MPEDPVEEPTGEEKIQDKAEDAVEETPDEEPAVEEEKVEAASEPEEKEDPVKEVEETVEPAAEVKEVTEKPAEKAKPADAKPEKGKDKKEKKKVEHDDDFQYIVRLSNTDIDGEKKIVYGLTTIKGLGVHLATMIADNAKIDRNKKVGTLSEKEIEKLQSEIDKISEVAPTWMLNHRKDYETGKDIHLIGAEIDLNLRDQINILKKIRSYRGIRHERNLPVRGQRTRANNRTGL